jgi:hypothetical protein
MSDDPKNRGDYKMTQALPIQEVDPRLYPEHLEHQLCAKARGLRRKCKKLASQRKTLMTMLRFNHEKLKRCQEEAISAEKALFEHQKLIRKIEPKRAPKKVQEEAPPSDNMIAKALAQLSEDEKLALIAELMAQENK